MSKKNEHVAMIRGTGIAQDTECVAHEIVGFPASTYHKFTYADGTVFWLNDFGIRSVTLANKQK